MSLRVGCDLDGVLADMESALVRHAEALFGEPMTRVLQERAKQKHPSEPQTEHDGSAADPDADNVPRLVTLDMSTRQERRLWQHIASVDGFWESLEEIEPGAVARLASHAEQRRWEVIFLTKRPESAGATAQVQSQRWLQAQGFTLPSVFVVQGSRGRVAEALQLDFVIDDRPENCLDVVLDSKARAILIWRDDEKNLPVSARRLGVGVVKSVAQCLAILEKVEAKRESARLVDRVKKALGFDEAPDA